MTVPLPADGDNTWSDWAAYVDGRVQGNGSAATPTTRTLGTGSSEAAPGNHTHSSAAASETAAGIVELADASEAAAGTDATRAVSPLRLKGELDKKSSRFMTINTVAATTYTLQVSDANDVLIRMTASTAITVTFPSDATAAIPVGASGLIRAAGTGQITCVAGSGATVNSRGSIFKSAGQWAGIPWTKEAANTFVIEGDLTA